MLHYLATKRVSTLAENNTQDNKNTGREKERKKESSTGTYSAHTELRAAADPLWSAELQEALAKWEDDTLARFRTHRRIEKYRNTHRHSQQNIENSGNSASSSSSSSSFSSSSSSSPSMLSVDYEQNETPEVLGEEEPVLEEDLADELLDDDSSDSQAAAEEEEYLRPKREEKALQLLQQKREADEESKYQSLLDVCLQHGVPNDVCIFYSQL